MERSEPLDNLLYRLFVAPINLIKFQLVQTHPEWLEPEMLESLSRRRQAARIAKDYRMIQQYSIWMRNFAIIRQIGITRFFFGWTIDLSDQYDLTVPQSIDDELCAWGRRDEASRRAERAQKVDELILPLSAEQFRPLLGALHRYAMSLHCVDGGSTRAESIEAAIHHGHLALDCYLRDSFPVDWAGTLHDLGACIKSRIIGNRAENLETALGHYQQSLGVRSRDVYPVDWAMTHNNLANLFGIRIHGERRDNLEAAIRHCHLALEVRTKTDLPVEWATTQNNLAISHWRRVSGDRAENIEAAILHHERSLEVRTRHEFPEDWAITHANLGIAHYHRLRGDPAENIEEAIRHSTLALDVWDQKSPSRDGAMLHANLGLVYQRRMFGDREHNLERSIFHSNTALAFFNRSVYPGEYAGVIANLASAYRKRGGSERGESIELALQHYQSVIELIGPTTPEAWIANHMGLAVAYLRRLRGNPVDNIQKSIQELSAVFDGCRRETFPIEWALTHCHLADAYLERALRADRVELVKSNDHYRSALEVYNAEAFPVERMNALAKLAGICLYQRDYAAALNCLYESLELERVIDQMEITEVSRLRRWQYTSEYAAVAAFCLDRLGQFGKSLEFLERGRARLHREKCARDQALLQALRPEDRKEYGTLIGQIQAFEAEQRGRPDQARALIEIAPKVRESRHALERLIARLQSYLPEFLDMRTLEYSQITACLSPSGRTALVAINITLFGTSMIFVAGTPQAPIERSIHHPSVTTETFKDFYQRWQSAQRDLASGRSHSPQAWERDIQPLLDELNDTLFQDLWLALDDLDIDTVILLPGGALQMVPLHLISRRQASGVREVLLDRVTVCYSPSFSFLTRKPQIKQPGDWSLFGVSNPTGDLPGSQRELELAQVYFPVGRSLVWDGGKATIHQVELSSPGFDVLHLACHGVNSPDPFGACLLLAPAEDGAAVTFQDPETIGTAAGQMPSGHVLRMVKNRSPLDDTNDEPRTSVREPESLPAGPQWRAIVIDPENPEHARGEAWLLNRILQHLKLPRTELVILSACESGVVEVEQLPDEYIGLASGFLAAGAQTVISTLWKIDDQATAVLMNRFYHFWRVMNQRPADALRNAQRWLREHTTYRSPYYWGAFLVSGRGAAASSDEQ